ncbi:hypothetical protein [Latilactobacillus sp. VITA-14]|uniref:hypothetical protein n=1 Tax=Latilactobacillus sp. VITA-14 TaxID=3367745 RepID=UPI00398197A9
MGEQSPKDEITRQNQLLNAGINKFESLFDSENKRKQRDRKGRKYAYILIGLTILAILFYNRIILMNFMIKIFMINDEFQWGGITAIVAILTFGYTAYNNQKRNKIDLISKSRIEWLSTVREVEAEYLKKISEYMLNHSTFTNAVVDVPDLNTANRSWENIKKITIDLQKTYTLLQLQFGKDEYNDLFLEPFETIGDKVNDSRKLIVNICKNCKATDMQYRKLNEYYKDIEKELESISINSRKYLKAEWDKAKSGK